MTSFHNPVKLNAGLRALDSLQEELASSACFRPLFLVSPGAEKAGAVRLLRRSLEYPEILIHVLAENGTRTPAEEAEMLLLRSRADGIVAVGGESVLKKARLLSRGRSLPFAAVPCGEYGGCGIAEEPRPELVVLDPRLFRLSAGLRQDGKTLSAGSSGEDDIYGKVWRQSARALFLSAREAPVRKKQYLMALAGAVAEMGGISGAASGTDADADADADAPAEVPAYFEFTAGGRIISGANALSALPEALRVLSARRPMLLSDAGVAAAGLTAKVAAALEKGAPPAVTDTDIPSDSDTTVVRRLADLYREKKCDSIVAVGGGSVLDTAKGVNILVGMGGTELSLWSGAGKIDRRLPPLAAIPTTSGTGSEATLVAVIGDHAARRKLLYTSVFLQPDLAVLDPEMTASLPPVLTAATGMDALTHAMEAYYCLGRNPLSDQHALAAVRLIGRHLLEVVEEPDNKEGRKALAEASNLAGIAFSNSMVGMVHTLGHSVGAVCGVHHGVCMSVLLPFGIEYNLSRAGSRMAPLFEALTGRSGEGLSGTGAYALAGEVRRLNAELHRLTGGRHPRTLAEAAGRDGRPLVRREDLPEIARAAMGDGSILYNPEELEYGDALGVLEAAFSENPDRVRDRSDTPQGPPSGGPEEFKRRARPRSE